MASKRNVLNEPEFVDYLKQLESDNGLSPGLLASLIQQESSGNPDAVGPPTKYGRARGLTQFIDATAREYGLLDENGDRRTDPRAAAEATARYLKDLRERFGGSEAAALAAYNGGTRQGRLVQAGYAPTFAETHDYVKKILGRMNVAVGPGTQVPFVDGDETADSPTALDAVSAATAQSLALSRLRNPEGEAPGQAALEKAEQRREDTGFTDVFKAAMDDPESMNHDLTGRVVDILSGGGEPADPTWDYAARRLDLTKGLSNDEAELMDEHGPHSEARATAALARIHEARSRAQVYEDAGTLTTLAGQLAASSLDMPSWALSMGAGKVLGMAKLGAAALIRAGKPARAVTAQFAENIGTELAVTALNDVSGGQMSAGDYLMVPAMAGILTAPFARGTYKAAAQRAVREAANDLHTRAVDLDTPATPEERSRAIQQQADEVEADLNSRAISDTAVIPDHARQILDEAEVMTPERVEEASVVQRTAEAELTKEIVAEVTPPKADGTPAPELDLPPIPDVQRIESEGKQLADFLLRAHKKGRFDDTRDMVMSFVAKYGRDNIPPDLQERLATLVIESKDYSVVDPARPKLLGTIDGAPIMMVMDDTKAQAAMKLIKMAKEDGGLYLGKVTLRDLFKTVEALREKDTPLDHGHRVVLKAIHDSLRERGDASLDSVHVHFATKHRGQSAPRGEVLTPVSEHPSLKTEKRVSRFIALMDQWGYDTLTHEIVHQVTQLACDAWKVVPSSLSPEVRLAIDRMEALRVKLEAWARVNKIPQAEKGVWYAAKNVQEFIAMAMSDAETQRALLQIPASSGFGGRLSTAMHEFIDMVKRIVFPEAMGGNPRSALNEAVWAFEVIMNHRLGGVVDQVGDHLSNAWPGNRPGPAPSAVAALGPVAYNGPPRPALNPMVSVGARRRFAEQMVQHARNWLAEHPIDMSRLNSITDRIGALSDGLKMARSRNPIMQMLSGILVETTTGASGRGNTAAVHKEMVRTRIIGNAVLDLDNAYADYKRARGYGLWNDLTDGSNRREFNEAVYDEIIRRRNGQQGSPDSNIVRAANTLERAFGRALEEMKDAAILGADRLPVDSVGYIPQQLDGRKLANARPGEIRELEEHLASHFAATLNWDTRFAGQFASYYIERARGRAMNSKFQDPGTPASAATEIRAVLEDMQNRAEYTVQASAALRAMSATSESGLGLTKKRLDVDLTGVLPGGARVLDFYDTDVHGLLMRYTNRVSGTVALTRFGVHGPQGIRHLRDAMTVTTEAADPPTMEEMEAFERVMSEISGEPIYGATVSHWAANLRTAVGLQRLGGMGFVQAAEVANLATTLGLDSLMSGISALPRLFGEVGRIKRGQDPQNRLLTHIEQWGGEFGAMSYKMQSPLDPPEDRLNTYIREGGVVTKMLGAGRYLQGKLSFFRGVMAVQHRMVAEQITMKAARYIQSARVDPNSGAVTFTNPRSQVALRDMGFTDDLVRHMALHINRVAQWDASGRLIGFDITQLPNRAAAEGFVQAVHRGVAQIIQGTFVGERAAWMHNDYLLLLGQLRTFSMTAAEKQWSRQRMNVGYARASGMLLAQMALVLPIHAARVQAASWGRDDSEKFIKENMAPAALVRATLNYASVSGVLGDVYDITAGIAGGWGGSDVRETLTGRTQTGAGSILGTVPAFGSVEQAHRAVMDIPKMATGKKDLYPLLKQLPFSNLPGLVQAINLTR